MSMHVVINAVDLCIECMYSILLSVAYECDQNNDEMLLDNVGVEITSMLWMSYVDRKY